MTVQLLDKLVHSGRVWRAGRTDAVDEGRLTSGVEGLDEALGGGWPRGALTELLSRRGEGVGLLLPALARLSEQQRWIAWVAPPIRPYAPALAAHGVRCERLLLVHRTDPEQDLWAMEQALRSGACSAVIAWPGRLNDGQVRRLQLAAEQGDSLGVLCRGQGAGDEPSPAALRLRVTAEPGALVVRVIKRRGGFGGARLRVPA